MSDQPLTRYGIQWNGPTEPLPAPMSDGYWTPWHLAETELVALRAEHARLQALVVLQAKEYTGRVAALQAQLTALHEALLFTLDEDNNWIDVKDVLLKALAALRGPHV